MTNELDSKLCKAFPLLYRDRFGDMRSTCMVWGFECGDGWFDLLYDLSEKLEALIRKMKEEHPDIEEAYLPAASQVKEKFGALRFYMTCSSDEMDALISKAEDRSERTCEICGKEGKLNHSGWMSVRCRDHWKDEKPYDWEPPKADDEHVEYTNYN